MEVNKERVKLWVAALRSKRFKQGTKVLSCIVNGQVKHCCLGVACEVAKENGLRIRRKEVSEGIWYGNSRTAALPDPVVEWFGLPDYDPDLDDKGLICTIANDQRRYSFRKIATLIERRYLKPAKAKKASK